MVWAHTYAYGPSFINERFVAKREGRRERARASTVQGSGSVTPHAEGGHGIGSPLVGVLVVVVMVVVEPALM